MKHVLTLAILLTGPGVASFGGGAFAQGVTPSGAIFGDGRDFSQDLTRPAHAAPRPSPTQSTQMRRAEQQRRANQNFPGTGRPVIAPPAPTPQPGAARAAATQPVAAPPITRPTPPTRPQPERPASPVAARPTLPAAAVPPPSTRAAPVTIQPGQSTGAARGGAGGSATRASP